MSTVAPISLDRSCLPKEARGQGNFLDSLALTLESALGPLTKSLFWISLAAVGLMSLPIFADVLARFTVRRSVPGIIELEEFLMIVIVFLALAHTQKKEGHIVIDLLTCRLPGPTARLLETFNHLVCTIFFGLVTWRTFSTIADKVAEYSPMLKLPVWFFIALSGLGLAFLALTLFQQLLKSLAGNVRDRAWLGLCLVLVAAAVVLSMPWWIKALPWQFGRLGYGVSGMGFMLFLLLIGMPIGFAMSLVGFIGLAVVGPNLSPALNTLGVAPYHTTASFILAVAPLFILMGLLASEAGISQELFDTANKWLGRLPGGLAMASVAGCAGFAAVCGDSMATAVTMGSVSLPEMKRKSYSPELSCGALAAGGTLGILIPPSVGFIFYAIVTEESVGKLFIAGIVPGLLLALLFIVCIWVMARIRPEIAPAGEASSWPEKFASLKGVIGMLFLFILILGGILGGIFSPTEGGGIGVVGAFLIMLVRRKLTWQGLLTACEKTVFITAKLLMILIGVGILSYFLAASRLPNDLAALVTGAGLNRYVILAGIIGIYILLGCLMNVIPMILLTLPALFPTVKAIGFDPIWFGVLTVIIMEMGQITPPIGVNVFALSSVAKDVPMGSIFVGIVPFFICMVLLLGILIAFPPLATWLVGVFF